MRRARLRYCRGGNPYLIALQREARRYFRTTWEGVGAIPCVVIMTVFLLCPDPHSRTWGRSAPCRAGRDGDGNGAPGLLGQAVVNGKFTIDRSFMNRIDDRNGLESELRDDAEPIRPPTTRAVSMWRHPAMRR